MGHMYAAWGVATQSHPESDFLPLAVRELCFFVFFVFLVFVCLF